MSTNKPKFVQVTDPFERKYLVHHFGDLDVPAISFDKNGSIWAPVDQLTAWRPPHAEPDVK